MALDEINQYPITATQIGENSFIDIDQYISPGVWESQKVPKSVLLELNPVNIQVACSDETTDLAVTASVLTFRMPHAMTLTEVRASVTTAPTGDVITVGVNQNGGALLSTKVTIDATEKTSTTAVTPPFISVSALTDDAEITVDIDGIGSTIAGTGLKITLIGTRA